MSSPMLDMKLDKIVRCEPAAWRPFAEEKWSHAVLYDSMESMAQQKATQLTDRVHLGECGSHSSRSEFEADGEWRTQRVGPIVISPGNFVRVAWRNCLRTESLLDAVAPSPVATTASFTWIVDADGKPIGNPPLHLHGAFVKPLKSSQILPLVNGDCNPLFWPPNCGQLAVALSATGSEDNQCTEEDGGLEGCVGLTLNPDFEEQFHESLSCGFFINDQRAAGSAPLEFFVEATGHLTLPGRRLPLSMHTPLYVPDNPFNMLGQMRVPTNVESYLLYSYVLPVTGTLLFAHGHSHMGAEESYLVAGRLSDIGFLETERKMGPLLTSESGFSSNAALKDHFLAAVQKSSTRILQVRMGQVEEVEGRHFARRPRFRYHNIRWPMREGDVISSLSLYAGTPETPRALVDGYHLTHLIWWLFYTSGGPTSLSAGHAESVGISAPARLVTSSAELSSNPPIVLHSLFNVRGGAAFGIVVLVVVVSVTLAIRLHTERTKPPVHAQALLL